MNKFLAALIIACLSSAWAQQPQSSSSVSATRTGKVFAQWWGAKGDGTTDDTTAVQSAINRASNQPGGMVLFPPGTYIVNSPLIFKQGVALVGTGKAYPLMGTVIKAGSSFPIGQPIIKATGGEWIEAVAVRHICFDASGISDGVWLNDVRGAVLDDLCITGINSGGPSSGISAISEGGNTVTVTLASALDLSPDDTVLITGVTQAGYDILATVVSAPSLTSFTYFDPTGGLAAGTGGTAQIQYWGLSLRPTSKGTADNRIFNALVLGSAGCIHVAGQSGSVLSQDDFFYGIRCAGGTRFGVYLDGEGGKQVASAQRIHMWGAMIDIASSLPQAFGFRDAGVYNEIDGFVAENTTSNGIGFDLAPSQGGAYRHTGVSAGFANSFTYPPLASHWDIFGQTQQESSVLHTFPPQTLRLTNGANENIVVTNSFVRVTGPTAAFSLGGFNLRNDDAQGDGTILYFYNASGQQMTINNNDANSIYPYRISTQTGANITLRSGNSSATFIYSAADQRWILMSTN